MQEQNGPNLGAADQEVSEALRPNDPKRIETGVQGAQPAGAPAVVTLHIKGPCGAMAVAMDGLRDQLRGWLIVSEAIHGHDGWAEVDAVMVNDTRRFNAYEEVPVAQGPVESAQVAPAALQAYFDLTEPLLKKFVWTAEKAGEVTAIVAQARAALVAEPVKPQEKQGEPTSEIERAWIAGYCHAGYTHDSYYAEVKAKEYAATQADPVPGMPSPAQGEHG